MLAFIFYRLSFILRDEKKQKKQGWLLAFKKTNQSTQEVKHEHFLISTRQNGVRQTDKQINTNRSKHLAESHCWRWQLKSFLPRKERGAWCSHVSGPFIGHFNLLWGHWLGNAAVALAMIGATSEHVLNVPRETFSPGQKITQDTFVPSVLAGLPGEIDASSTVSVRPPHTQPHPPPPSRSMYAARLLTRTLILQCEP